MLKTHLTEMPQKVQEFPNQVYAPILFALEVLIGLAIIQPILGYQIHRCFGTSFNDISILLFKRFSKRLTARLNGLFFDIGFMYRKLGIIIK